MSHQEDPVPTEKNLCAVRCGELVRVRRINSEPATTLRLQEMGFCQDSEVCKIADGNALICKVCNMRVVLSRDLASRIVVEAVRQPATDVP